MLYHMIQRQMVLSPQLTKQSGGCQFPIRFEKTSHVWHETRGLGRAHSRSSSRRSGGLMKLRINLRQETSSHIFRTTVLGISSPIFWKTVMRSKPSFFTNLLGLLGMSCTSNRDRTCHEYTSNSSLDRAQLSEGVSTTTNDVDSSCL